jgi:hypothetical protein
MLRLYVKNIETIESPETHKHLGAYGFQNASLDFFTGIWHACKKSADEPGCHEMAFCY